MTKIVLVQGARRNTMPGTLFCFIHRIKSSLPLRRLILTSLLLMLLAPALWAKGEYMSAEQFLEQSFGNSKPETHTLWLTPEQKAEISKFMYRKYRNLRVRYWQQAQRSAWIFDEVGKERPITIGLVLDDNQITSVEILAFRESRGWEVKYDFFTAQFEGAQLTENNRLDQPIDGITGATLSVKAVTRAAQLALFLQQLTPAK